ncbi:hypothetical protein COCCADRAFT_92307 [Bipolaris zeicola 26-R-13]|uniref:DUF4048 domain-containing protein n=1 Tax=Cochliobolus carbonum (strain 26-R-13) TaxID=930089 RepID=W6YTM1_COCC2|nr:uncharacterized protein COCCADRAFT_92307 [Bipolaris zeicola 26-R-13]EUC34861.1 hypothetical protein COCCADRAFT_92307 [Bipolaris zeicola 26-R-13]
MGSRSTAGPALLRSWFSWFRGSLLLRLVGPPTALLALYLEVYGSSPAAASLILHRLARRFHLPTLFCALATTQRRPNPLSDRGPPPAMDRAQTQTLHHKGADPLSYAEISSAHAASMPASPSQPPAKAMSAHSRSKTVDIVGQGKRLSLQFPIQPTASAATPASATRTRPHKRHNQVRRVAPLQPLDTSLANSPPTLFDDDASGLSMQKEMERRKNLLSHSKPAQRKVFSGSRHLRTLSLLSPDRVDSPSFPHTADLLDNQSPSMRPLHSARTSTSSEITRPLVSPAEHDRYDMGGMPTIQREQLIRAGTQMATDFKKGLFTFIEDIRQATVGDEAVHTTDSASGSASAKGSKTNRKSSETRPPLSRSASSKKSTQQTGSFGDDFWKEMGLSDPKATATNKKTQAIKSTSTPQKQIRKVASEEDWDNWDTPNDSLLVDVTDPKDSSDDSDTHNSSISGLDNSNTSSSARYHAKRHDSKASSLTSINQDDFVPREQKRSSITWPDMTKVSPSNLKRTASHLMKEWEKQLTPPPESRNQDYAHGDYMN